MILSNIFWRFQKSRILKRIKHFGVNFTLSRGFDINCPESLFIGENVYIGPDFWADCRGTVAINSGTILGPRVKIHSINHRYDVSDFIPYDTVFIEKAVVIQENVWVGSDVIILPGVTVGEGAVIGTGSVVVKDIPKLAVVGGNPSRVIKYRNFESYFQNKNANKIYLLFKNNPNIN